MIPWFKMIMTVCLPCVTFLRSGGRSIAISGSFPSLVHYDNRTFDCRRLNLSQMEKTKRRIGIVFLLILIFATSLPGLAQDHLTSLGELIRHVVETDPGVKALQADRQAANSEVRRNKAGRLPKIYLMNEAGAGQMVNDLANVVLTGLTPVAVTDPVTRARLADLSATRPYYVPTARLENTLFDGGRTSAAIISARLNAEKAAVAEERARQQEAYLAAARFLNLAYDQVMERYLEQFVQVTRLTSTALSAQADSGRITQSEALAAAAKMHSASAALADARDDLRLISSLLRQQANFKPDSAFDTRSLESRLLDSAFPESVSVIPADSNPELKIATLDYRLQQEAVNTARSRRLPDVRFVAEYGFAFSNLLFTFRPGFNAGLQATIPLFTGHELEQAVKTEMYRSEAARLRRVKMAESVQEEYLMLAAQSRRQVRDYQAARAELDRSEENYRIARLKYYQGAGSDLNLLEAAELLLNSRRQCLDLTRANQLLRWRSLMMQGKLVDELERAEKA